MCATLIVANSSSTKCCPRRFFLQDTYLIAYDLLVICLLITNKCIPLSIHNLRIHVFCFSNASPLPLSWLWLCSVPQSIDATYQPQPPAAAGSSCNVTLMPWSPFPCRYDATKVYGVPGQKKIE